MGATNHTTNYNLSQFIGTDKPSWLQDYNGDMSLIDTSIKAAKTKADTADGKADAIASVLSGKVVCTGTHQITVPFDGVKTTAEILNDLHAAIVAYVSAKDASYRWNVAAIEVSNYHFWEQGGGYLSDVLLTKDFADQIPVFGPSNVLEIVTGKISTNDSAASIFAMNTATYTDVSSTVDPVGASAYIKIREFTVLA